MPIKVEKSGPHLTITLVSPDTSNALNVDMVEALISTLSNVDDVRSCVFLGEGQNFCAGFDLSDIDVLSDGDLLHRFLRIETMLQMIYHAPFPTLAFCQGHVIGAGADLMAACWKRVADPSATFKMPGWNFELALGTRRLANLIGSEQARDLLIDTRRIAAEEALSIGLVSRVAAQSSWAEIIESQIRRSVILPRFSSSTMFGLTRPDTRAQDIASIVATAGRPGLNDRIKAYGTSVAAARQQRKGV
ncbi:MAG: enoyl-CoA hydratase/isomerase family protein [Sulfitobacter sp.]